MGRNKPIKGIETTVKSQDLIGRRHAQICDAALKLFSRKGFHRSSVREIAKECGLGIGTLYSYIKTKEDILSPAYRRILETFEARMLSGVPRLLVRSVGPEAMEPQRLYPRGGDQ